MCKARSSERWGEIVDSEEAFFSGCKTILAYGRIWRKKAAHLLGTAGFAGADGSCALLRLA